MLATRSFKEGGAIERRGFSAFSLETRPQGAPRVFVEPMVRFAACTFSAIILT